LTTSADPEQLGTGTGEPRRISAVGKVNEVAGMASRMGSMAALKTIGGSV
jgi:hypothetical protein